jgi:hypothetical protein
VKVAANLKQKKIVYFPVPRNSSRSLSRPVHIDSVFAALAEKFAAVPFNVFDEVLALHAAESETASRITS